LHGIAAAVPYYGGGMTHPLEIARTPRCPVLAHFARHDQSIPLQGVTAFGQAHPEVELHLYDASHGFNCDHRGAHDASAAALALRRTQAFFKRLMA
jgi:carboxymethylenebutenolidase